MVTLNHASGYTRKRMKKCKHKLESDTYWALQIHERLTNTKLWIFSIDGKAYSLIASQHGSQAKSQHTDISCGLWCSWSLVEDCVINNFMVQHKIQFSTISSHRPLTSFSFLSLFLGWGGGEYFKDKLLSAMPESMAVLLFIIQDICNWIQQKNNTILKFHQRLLI